MSELNQKYIDELAEFEYHFRDGLVFEASQLNEIILICEAIIDHANSN
jgi:hypothetical protein